MAADDYDALAVRYNATQVLSVISAFVPPPTLAPQEPEQPPLPQPRGVPMYQAQQGQFSYNYQQQSQSHQSHVEAPQPPYQPAPEIDLLQGFDDDDDDAGADEVDAPEPAAQSAFGFIGGVTPSALTPQAPAPVPSAPPMTASSFGFLNASAQPVAPTAPTAPAPAVHLSSTSRPPDDRPLHIEDLSATRTPQQPTPVYAGVPSTAAVPAPSASAFAFIGGGAPAAMPAQLPLARTVDVWDGVPVLTPMVGVPQSKEPEVRSIHSSV